MVTLWKTVPWLHGELRKIVDRADRCTCHIPRHSKYGRHDVDPRPIILVDGSSEWQHVDDGTAASTHHAHCANYGSGCDGVVGDDYVELPTPGEEGGWEFTFWMRMLDWCAVASDESGQLSFSTDDNGHYRADYRGLHDEGQHWRSVRMCADPHCAYERGEHYDHFARAAGY